MFEKTLTVSAAAIEIDLWSILIISRRGRNFTTQKHLQIPYHIPDSNCRSLVRTIRSRTHPQLLS